MKNERKPWPKHETKLKIGMRDLEMYIHCFGCPRKAIQWRNDPIPAWPGKNISLPWKNHLSASHGILLACNRSCPHPRTRCNCCSHCETQQPRPLRLSVSYCSSLLNLMPSPFRPTKKTMKKLRMSENRWIFCSKNPFGALCKTSLFLPSLTNSCHA